MEKQGKIYKIVNSVNNIIYVGSTESKYLSKRMGHHRENCLKVPNCGKLYPAMIVIGIEKFKIILLELIPFKDKEELRAKEYEWINKLDTVNNGYNTMLKDGQLPEESIYKCRKSLVKYYKGKNEDVGIYRRNDSNSWRCIWQEVINKSKSKSFSIATYGEEGAKQMAIDYRNKMTKDINIYN